MKKDKPAFRVYFNKRRQWFDVYIADKPRKFIHANKAWAYYMPHRTRKHRKGLFGTVHFSRVGSGLVAHELAHLLFDWIKTSRSKTVTDRNEENVVTMFGEMVRMFWVRYYHWKENTSI
jgi:hypothetical protein